MEPSRVRLAFLAIALVLIGLVLIWSALPGGSDLEERGYSEMLADAAAGQIASISQDGTQLTVTPVGGSEPYVTYVASESINTYAEVCAAAGYMPGPECPIQYSVNPESTSGQWLGLLITSLLPVLLIGSFFFFMMRAQRAKRE